MKHFALFLTVFVCLFCSCSDVKYPEIEQAPQPYLIEFDEVEFSLLDTVKYCFSLYQTETANMPAVSVFNANKIVGIQFWLDWTGGALDTFYLHEYLENAVTNSGENYFRLSWVSPGVIPMDFFYGDTLVYLILGIPFLEASISRVEFSTQISDPPYYVKLPDMEYCPPKQGL